MKLAKYVKFREEKFGGVLFETRSEKVFTLNPTATAIIREIAGRAPRSEIADRVKAHFEGNGGAIEREVSEFLADLRARASPRTRVRKPVIRPAVSAQAEPESQHLSAPLYVAWQITNECNLACMHCIEESGPGKRFKDELTEAQVFAVLEQMMAQRDSVPVVLRRRADAPSAVLRDGRSTSARAAASSRSRPTAISSRPRAARACATSA